MSECVEHCSKHGVGRVLVILVLFVGGVSIQVEAEVDLWKKSAQKIAYVVSILQKPWLLDIVG